MLNIELLCNNLYLILITFLGDDNLNRSTNKFLKYFFLISIIFFAISFNNIAFGATNDAINIRYQSHVQNIGWQNYVHNGSLSGTTGQALRVEGVKIFLENAPANVHVKYQAHVEGIGWQDWKYDNSLAGTEGKGLSIEAIKIVLEGLPTGYHVQYQAHVQNIGWQNLVQDGEIAGTTGKALKIEALQINIVAPTTAIRYKSKMENSNFKPWVDNGAVSGAAGQGLKMTGINIDIQNAPSDLKVKYQTHVQNAGWTNWVYDGQTSGKPNENLRIEGLRIVLEGNTANYHVQYQAYVQGIGWQRPVYDGAIAGIVSKTLRIEAIKVSLIKVDPAKVNSLKKNMKIAIDKGHNARFDSGSTGIRQEDDLTKEVGNKVISKLQNLGYIVVDCSPSNPSSTTNSLDQRAQISNSNEVGLFASIHFNCFNRSANGTEVYYRSNESKSLAQSVLNNIVSLGYNNRGIKYDGTFYVLKHATPPAILIECSFIDSPIDMKKYNSESLSNAIVRGLTSR